MSFKKTLSKRIISLFLSLAIVSTTFPELGLYVHAAAVENSTSIGESTDSSNTEDTDDNNSDIAPSVTTAPIEEDTPIELNPIQLFTNETSINNLEKVDYKNNSYSVIDIGVSWTEAKEYCENIGGHLVTISDSDEQNFVTDLLLTYGKKNLYWNGGYKENSSSNWKWVTDEEFTFFNWNDGEPNSNAENYIHMFRVQETPGKWNNTLEYSSGNWFYGSANSGFICEWDNTVIDEPEETVESYTVFSNSQIQGINLYGWKSSFTGDIYTGNSFNYGGSELYINGKVDAVGSIVTNGWKTEIDERNEHIDVISMPDFDSIIHENAQPYEYYEESPTYIQDKNIINSSIKVSGDVSISGTTFEGDCYIIAGGNITYNVQNFNSNGRVFLYSQNGNITISGSQININGALYAPNGNVTFNTYDTTITGFVYADTINFNGSIFNISGANFDMVESKGIVKTYTTDADFSEGILNGVCSDVPNQLTLSENKNDSSETIQKVFGDAGSGKGIKITYTSEKAALSENDTNVTIKYDLSGFGEADTNENAIDLIIVVDESGSMSGQRMTNTKNAAKEIVAKMKDTDRCAVIGFTYSARVIQSLTSDKNKLSTAIESLYANGGTTIYRGLDSALNMFENMSDESRQKYIILLSDGEDESITASLNSAKKAGDNNIRIFAMTIGNGTLQMQNIAINSNGIYRNAPTVEDIGKVMSYFAAEVFNVAGRKTTFKTTINNINSIDLSSISPTPSEIKENSDGSVTLKWDFDRISIDEAESISLTLDTNNLNGNFAELTSNTSCVYYDRAGKPHVIYLEDAQIPVSKYISTGDWSVIFDSEKDDTAWTSIYWNGVRYGDGSIKVYASAGNDGTNYSEPINIENYDDISGLIGRFIKLDVYMNVSSDGKSPILYDITLLSEKDVPDYSNEQPQTDIYCKDSAKINMPVNIRAEVSDDCLTSDITVLWSCDSENAVFANEESILTTVTFSEVGDYEIVCSVSDGKEIVTTTHTITVEPLDAYEDIDPDIIETVLPKIKVDLPKYADKRQIISSKIELLTETEISWYSVIFNNKTAVAVEEDGSFSLTMPNRNGTYKVIVRAFDWAGNSDTKEYTITVDSTVPTIKITPSKETVAIGEEAYFTVVKEAEHKISSINYTINGNETEETEDGIYILKTEEAGTYALRVEATTLNGGVITAEAELVVIETDTTEPDVQIILEKETYGEGETVTGKIIVFDDSAVDKIGLNIDDTSVQLDEENNFTVYALSVGIYTITAKAYDSCGNLGETSRTIEISDITAPEISLACDKTEIELGESVNITASANDKNGIKSIELYFGDERVEIDGDTVVITPNAIGEYVVSAIAHDSYGNENTAEITITVIKIDRESPEIFIEFDKDAYYEGEIAVMTITATDNEGVSEIIVSFDGKTIEANNGIYSTPVLTEGEHTIEIKACDDTGNKAEIAYQLIAGTALDVTAPIISIDSIVPENIYVGDTINIYVSATDENGIGSITAIINNDTVSVDDGVITYIPESAGNYSISVTVTDTSGNAQTISVDFTVNDVIPEDTTPPQVNINNIPDIITLGESIELNIEASDDSGNVYVKVTANDEVIANEAGTTIFTPDKAGEYLLSISAWDDSENIITLSKTINVVEKVSEDTTAPVYVDSEIPEYVIAHEETRIKVTAVDDSGKVFYAARINGENVECNDGEVIFTPERAGDYIIQVIFYDEALNARGIQIIVYANDQTLPTMTVTGLTHYMNVGESALITIDAQDDSGTVYVTATINGESVEIVDNQFEFIPTETGIHKLIIRAEDPSANYAQKEFDISVSEAPVYEDENPVITINANSGSDTAKIGDTVDVKVSADDPDGIVSLKVTVNGEELELDENGNAYFVPEEKGRYVISATAVDSLDNEITEELEIKVIDEDDDSVCEVAITSPADGNAVTSPVEIIGSVTGDGLVYYTLEYCPANGDEYIEFAYGEETVESGVLGKFDPTLLENGYYNIRLTAYSSNYNVTDEIVVSVEGQMKIGNYSIAFQDMDIPVAGYPLTVIRSYDSRRKQISGNFGYGWDMTLSSITLSESCAPGNYWTQEVTSSGYASKYYFTEERPHEISIDYGNGRTEKFKMKLSPDQQNFYPIDVGISVKYEAQGNTKSKLEAIGTTTDLIYNSGILCYSSTIKPYNPEKYKLTRADGTVYIISDTNGVESITDTNGNTITITDSGVTHSDGKSISFERDSENRIQKITGPTGKTIEYSYDESGNLSVVTDEAGEKTTFEYDRNHYLTDIINSNGVKIARNEYDDDGRLIATVDANGNRLEFSHDIEGRRDVVTDRLGNSTLYVYDNSGNVISETDALGNTTLSTYDSNGNLATKTDALGNVTTYNYDSEGNLLSITDPLGNTVTNTYSEKNQLLSITSMGVTQFIVDYDEYGNLTSTEDAMGNEISYEYDSGKVTSITDEIGTYMKMTYDGDGNVVSAVNGVGETATFTYDEDGNCASKTITRGSETLTEQYSYDIYGNVTQVIYADGSVTSVEYDSVGNMTAAVDSKGRRTSYEYDLFGNLVKITYCDNTTETFEYDAEGRNTKATDRMGRSVKMTYDAVGNLISKSYPNGSKVTYSYDKKYRLTSVTAANGGATSYVYDVLDRNTAITDALGNKTKFSYSTSNGQLETMTDPMGNTYTYGYDLNGNRTSVTMPDGTTISTAYDARGRVTSQTDQYGNVTRYTYDGADRLTSVTDALGSVWKYKYNSVGELVSVTDPMGNTTRYEYDNGGRVTKTTNALGNTATATYDETGNVLTSTDYAGNVTVYTYDELDRVVAKALGGETILYSYTTDGLLASVTDNSGTISYEYDIMNGLTAVTLADGKKIHYTYDDSCRLTSVETPFGTTSYEYDLLDRLVRVVAHDGTATLYEYDANGNRTEVHYANGIVIKYVFDEVNRLICEKVLDKDGELVAQYTYTLGALGERLKVEETDGDSSRTVEYEYDDVYRLISETVTDESGTTVTSYTYDKNSNRLTKTVGEEVTEYSYNELNQLISETGIEYSYDLNGNLIEKKALAETTTYTYNKRNRLIRVTAQNGADVNVEEYLYDYAGNRTAKIQEFKTTYYLVDTNGALSQVLAEYDENGTLITSYTRADQLISQERDGVKSYYLYDGFDSVRMLTDDEGTVTDTYTYNAFGNLISSTGETVNDFLYRGEQFDSFTGLYYLRARYMNPSTGTFITMDEYAGSIFEPVSLHKYLYANANPVMYSDPSGYMSVGQLIGSMAIGAILGSMITATLSGIFSALITGLKGGNTRDVLDAFYEGFESGKYIGIALGALGSLAAEYFVARYIMFALEAIFAGISVRSGVEDLDDGYIEAGALEIGIGLLLVFSSARNALVGAKMQAASAQNASQTAQTTTNNSNTNTCTADSCFTGDTLILGEEGQKRIDEIEIGNKVWAYNIETGEMELKEVLNVFIKENKEILHLETSNGQNINTTTNHPFYVIDKGWVAAGDLEKGDELYTADGDIATVTSFEIERFAEPVTVYNLEVYDFHTYFVGCEHILVHNSYDVKRMTSKESTVAAKKLGFEKTNYRAKNGEPIYYNKKTKTYISQDVGSGNGMGSHNGGVWKQATSPEALNSKSTRMGTYNADLTERIGD